LDKKRIGLKIVSSLRFQVANENLKLTELETLNKIDMLKEKLLSSFMAFEEKN